MLYRIVAEDYVTNKRVTAHVTADSVESAVRIYSMANEDRYIVTVDRVASPQPASEVAYYDTLTGMLPCTAIASIGDKIVLRCNVTRGGYKRGDVFTC